MHSTGDIATTVPGADFHNQSQSDTVIIRGEGQAGSRTRPANLSPTGDRFRRGVPCHCFYMAFLSAAGDKWPYCVARTLKRGCTCMGDVGRSTEHLPRLKRLFRASDNI